MNFMRSGNSDNTKFYTILGVDKNADDTAIKKAYRKACVRGEYRHPDKVKI